MIQELTQEETKQLQEYLFQMNKLAKEEPTPEREFCTSDEFDKITNYFLKQDGQGEPPPKAEYFKLFYLTDTSTGEKTKSFYYIPEKEWNDKCVELNKKYDELLTKAIKIEMQKSLIQDQSIDMETLLKEVLTDAIKNYQFLPYLQGEAINKLTFSKTKEATPDIYGNAYIKIDENFQLKINDYCSLKGGIITPQTKQLLDCFILAFSQAPNNAAQIRLPLETYMEWRGLSDEKSARKQVLEGIKALKSIEYKAKERIKGKWHDSGYISIYGGTGYIKDKIIYFNFNSDFYENLLNYSIMDYHKDLLKLNTYKFPHATYFGYWILLNYRMNEGKNRVKTISIKTLMQKAPLLPTYEEVSKSSAKQYYKRIVKPVIDNLDALDFLCYDFITKDGTIIENPLEEFKGTAGYQLFENSSIKVDYSDFPKNTKRIEAKEKHKANFNTSKDKEAGKLAAKSKEK